MGQYMLNKINDDQLLEVIGTTYEGSLRQLVAIVCVVLSIIAVMVGLHQESVDSNKALLERINLLQTQVDNIERKIDKGFDLPTETEEYY